MKNTSLALKKREIRKRKLGCFFFFSNNVVTENVCQLTVVCRKSFLHYLSKCHKFIVLSESSKKFSQGFLCWEECPDLEFVLSYWEILPQLVPKLLKANFRYCLLFKIRKKKKKRIQRQDKLLKQIQF